MTKGTLADWPIQRMTGFSRKACYCKYGLFFLGHVKIDVSQKGGRQGKQDWSVGVEMAKKSNHAPRFERKNWKSCVMRAAASARSSHTMIGARVRGNPASSVASPLPVFTR